MSGEATGQDAFALEAVSENTFVNETSSIIVEFKQTFDSEIQSFTLYQGRNVSVWEKEKFRRNKNMKKLLLILLSVLLTASAFAQSNIKLKHKYGTENGELQSLLYFEGIQLERLTFTGSDLKNKDYQIYIKKFVNGSLAQTEMIFDSKELARFKITGEELALRAYAKVTSGNTVKFSIESNVYGYRADREYKIAPDQKAFALKNFLGAKPEQEISLKDNNHLLAFMMPYVRKDGSGAYCEVVQSDVTPEELGKKYPIPLYFLIDIKFQ